jgi:hypothetical protein
MPRKLQTKHYVENDSEKISKTLVETKRGGKDNVVEEKQPPPRAKTIGVKALKDKDGKGDDGGKRPPRKVQQNVQRYKVSIAFSINT